MSDGRGRKEISYSTVTFNHVGTKNNNGFTYNVPQDIHPMCKRYLDDLCKEIFTSNKFNFLKNCNIKGKCRVQNMRKLTHN